MTFREFVYLEPGATVVSSAFGRCVYVRAQRRHPMAAALADAVGIPVTESPIRSVIANLREAYQQVYFPGPDGYAHPASDEDIIAFETAHCADPYSYYTAIVRTVEGVVEVSVDTVSPEGSA